MPHQEQAAHAAIGLRGGLAEETVSLEAGASRCTNARKPQPAGVRALPRSNFALPDSSGAAEEPSPSRGLSATFPCRESDRCRLRDTRPLPPPAHRTSGESRQDLGTSKNPRARRRRRRRRPPLGHTRFHCRGSMGPRCTVCHHHRARRAGRAPAPRNTSPLRPPRVCLVKARRHAPLPSSSTGASKGPFEALVSTAMNPARHEEFLANSLGSHIPPSA